MRTKIVPLFLFEAQFSGNGRGFALGGGLQTHGETISQRGATVVKTKHPALIPCVSAERKFWDQKVTCEK